MLLFFLNKLSAFQAFNNSYNNLRKLIKAKMPDLIHVVSRMGGNNFDKNKVQGQTIDFVRRSHTLNRSTESYPPEKMKIVLKTRSDHKLYYLIQCATLFSVLGGFICLLLNKFSFEFNNPASVIFKPPYILLILAFPLLFLLFPKKFPGYKLFLSFIRSTAYFLTIAGISLLTISIIYIFKADFYTPVAAVNFIFSGFCLMYLTTPLTRKKQSFHLFLLFPIIINSVAITIYFFDPRSDLQSTHATSIITTCMLSLILFTGIAFLLLDKEYEDFFFNKSLKSRVIRHLLPIVLTIPFTALLFKLDLLDTLFKLF